MKDTIYREDAIKVIKDADVVVFYDKDTEIDDAIEIAIRCTKKCLIGDIEELPSAEPKTGNWIVCEDDRFVKCSECGMKTTRNELRGISLFGKNEPNFCPNCGSKMEGK